MNTETLQLTQFELLLLLLLLLPATTLPVPSFIVLFSFAFASMIVILLWNNISSLVCMCVNYISILILCGERSWWKLCFQWWESHFQTGWIEHTEQHHHIPLHQIYGKLKIRIDFKEFPNACKCKQLIWFGNIQVLNKYCYEK